MYQEGRSASTQMKAWGLPTCGHVEEEGENTASVITSPEQPARGIKGQSKDAACQLAGATFHFLSRGDVHDMYIVLGIPHLWVRIACYHPAPSQSHLESDHSGTAINGTHFSLLKFNYSGVMVGNPEVTQAYSLPKPVLLAI